MFLGDEKGHKTVNETGKHILILSYLKILGPFIPSIGLYKLAASPSLKIPDVNLKNYFNIFISCLTRNLAKKNESDDVFITWLLQNQNKYQ